MKLTLLKNAIIVSAIATLAGCASTTSPGAVDVDRRQLLIVPAAQLEQMAQVSFNEQNEKARAAGMLVTQGAEYDRVRRISDRLQPPGAGLPARRGKLELGSGADRFAATERLVRTGRQDHRVHRHHPHRST